MSYSNGPKIVTDGIIMCLDAANNKSYPGYGAIWYDLSNNKNHATLVNAPVFSGSWGGNLNFNGTNQYATTPITGSYSTFTIGFWSFFDDPTLSVTSRNESVFGDWTPTDIHFGSRWSVGVHYNVNSIWSPAYNVSSVLRYGWNYYVLVYDTATITKAFYLNGRLIDSRTTNAAVAMTDFRIGVATSLNAYYKGNLATFNIYNRVLSEAEVLQNFNAQRGRFGL